MLPYVLRFNALGAEETEAHAEAESNAADKAGTADEVGGRGGGSGRGAEQASLAQALRVVREALGAPEGASAASAVDGLVRALGLPRTLSEVGVTASGMGAATRIREGASSLSPAPSLPPSFRASLPPPSLSVPPARPQRTP